MIKGEHVGSEWLTLQLNRYQGLSLLFEVEDCSSWSGKGAQRDNNLSVLSVDYLKQCKCPKQCTGCNTVSAPRPSVGCIGQRARGFSMNNNPPSHIPFMEQLVRANPRLAIVLHTRRNSVKTVFSATRSGCQGQSNHAFTSTASATSHARPPNPVLHISPAYMLHRTIERVRDQMTRRLLAASLAKMTVHGRVVHEVVYERMQSDGVDAEIARLLQALGVPALASENVTDAYRGGRRLQQIAPMRTIKTGTEDLRKGLSNFDEVSAHFKEEALRQPSLTCLHEMLVDKQPREIPFYVCEQIVFDALTASNGGLDSFFSAHHRSILSAQRMFTCPGDKAGK